MALGQFQISFQSMQETVERAKQQSNEISELLAAMKTEVDKHRAHWVGSAADSFQQAYDDCHQKALVLPQALDAAGRTLAAINEGTSDTESANAKRFGPQ
ncbi:WXG100 family type VII secretion target [Kutzneria chonburiensis]|uniref:ESAT-6-like protein n=1 Tax=Kutzneria chonburiensis TaxID=1483604 RepID=A0ABV6N644_9PSEU|nr:WXG100 family type VII secretion target [Kutzneria chonburiensis]